MTKPIKSTPVISIDATALNIQRTGTVTYVIEILRCFNHDQSLEYRFVVFVTPSNRHHFDELVLDQRFTLILAPKGKFNRLLWQQTSMVWHLWRQQIGLHWGPTFVLPWYAPCPCIVTVHDMTFELFPLAHERLKRLYFPAMTRLAVARAKTVLAVSCNTANDLSRLIPASRPKTRVTRLAAAMPHLTEMPTATTNTLPTETPTQPPIELPIELPIEPPIRPPFILSVGTIEPRKNLPRLVAAWQQLSESERHGHRLLIVGATGWLVDDWRSAASQDKSVVFAGHLSDQQLAASLRVATAFAYPSLYEGFGLPVLEAMAHGVPVLTSRVSATLEIAGDAALLVDPESVDDIRAAIVSLLTDADLRERLVMAGKARAAQFSWQRTATQTMAAIEDSMRS